MTALAFQTKQCSVFDVLLPNKTVLGVQELDRELTLKRNVAKKIGLIQRRKKLQTAFREPLRYTIPDSLADNLVESLRADANPNYIANLFISFSAAKHEAKEADNKRRAVDRLKVMQKKKRIEYPSYFVPKLKREIIQLKKWQIARTFLAPFIRDQTTDGLVLLHGGGIDLSITGTSRILKKASMVYLYCGLRQQGNNSKPKPNIYYSIHAFQLLYT